jgi:hypothetical protein
MPAPAHSADLSPGRPDTPRLIALVAIALLLASPWSLPAQDARPHPYPSGS